MNAPTVPPQRWYRPVGHPCDKLCREAVGPRSGCTCACGGERHGVSRPAQEAALVASLARIAADPFARISVVDEEAW